MSEREAQRVRVVVGHGEPASGASIIEALTAAGFRVVGDASTPDELAGLLRTDPPDVVVLDDTIGVAAAQVAVEAAPRARLVVLWPAAVLPTAGATRVDAAELSTALAPAVAAAAGVASGAFTTIDRPGWIDAVRKDPATLREKLAAADGVPDRPSVTELQRPADEDDGVRRRLAIIALAGAALAATLMIALAVGRSTPTVVVADRFVPPATAPSDWIPDPRSPTTDGSGSGGNGAGHDAAPTGSGPTTAPVGETATGRTGGDAPGTDRGGRGGGADGADQDPTPAPTLPGASAVHNPHGGPPGLLRHGWPPLEHLKRGHGHWR